MDSFFNQSEDGVNEEELLRELEQLSISETRAGGSQESIEKEMERKEALKLDQKLADYERRIQVLRQNEGLQ